MANTDVLRFPAPKICGYPSRARGRPKQKRIWDHLSSSAVNGFEAGMESQATAGAIYVRGICYTSFLPAETLLHLFTFLEPADLMAIANVCKDWAVLSKEEGLWQRY